MSADILVVDDEADIRDLVAGILDDEGHRSRTAGSSDEALAAIESRRPHLVFLDIWLQGSRLDGLQVLDLIKASHPDLPVVMISGHGNIETAVSAIKAGAYDFIEKPFKAGPADPGRRARAGGLAPQARGPRPHGTLRHRQPHRRQLGGDQPAPPDPGPGRPDQRPGDDHWRAGLRQGARRARPAQGLGPGQRAVRAAQRGRDPAGDHGIRAVRRRGRRRAGEAGRRPSRRRMAARSTSTRSPTCRARRKGASCASSSTRTFNAWGGPPACMSTSASSRRRRATSPRRSPRDGSARTCSIGSRWCRSACPRSRSAARTCRS